MVGVTKITVLKIIIILALICVFCITLFKERKGEERKRTLIIGAYPYFKPFSYLDRRGDRIGFDIDIIKRVFEDLGYDIKIVNLEFAELIPSLLENRLNVAISALTINTDRYKDVSFSQQYFRSYSVIIVPYTDNSVQRLDDLKNKRVGVLEGSVHYNTIKDIPNIRIVNFKTKEEQYIALNEEKVDAVLDNYFMAQQFVNDRPFLKLRIINKPLTYNYYGIAFSKNVDKSLMNRVDLKIRELKNTGEYNEIYNKWFGKRFYNDGYEVSEFGDNF